MRKIQLLLCLLGGFISVLSFAQNFNWQNNLKELSLQEGESFRVGIISFYDSIEKLNNYKAKMEIAQQAFELTKEKDDLAHVHSLLYRATRSIPPQTSLFNEAFDLALKHSDIDEMCKVEYERGRFFIARKQFDSAVIHILNYKDLTIADIKGDGYQNILEILGDVYYHAGLYDQAMELYLQIYEEYESTDHWNYYRPYVLMNNMGQIYLKLGETNKAKEWFEKSLERAEAHLQQYYRFNSLAYIRVKLAETAIKTEDYKEAAYQLEMAHSYPIDRIQNDVKQEMSFHGARLLLRKNKTEEAIQLAKTLMPCDSLPGIGFRFVPQIYRLMAELADKQGNDSLSIHCYKTFYSAEDSLKQQESLARSMIILAEREHEITKLELYDSERRNWFFAMASLVLFLVFIMVLLFYRKLYKSKLQLMEKSMVVTPISEEVVLLKTKKDEQNQLKKEEIIQQQQLIEELKQTMDREKPYLDSAITIQKVAVLLSTNRTYLSKAINSQLDTSFPNLINEYRIREAIHLISSGYAENHTQEALAKKAGFASRNVFTNAFKKQIGVLPSFFIANYKKLGERGTKAL